MAIPPSSSNSANRPGNSSPGNFVVKIVLSVGVWYVANTFATYFAKALLSGPDSDWNGDAARQAHLAVCLSFVQLFVSGAIGFFVMRIRAKAKPTSVDHHLENAGLFTYILEARKKQDPAYKKITMTAAFNAVGATCVNMAYVRGSVSSVQVIKALEPVTTYVLSAGILKTKGSPALFFSMFLVVAGSVLTCLSDSAYDRESALLAVISNFMMPLRNVVMKSAEQNPSDIERGEGMRNARPTGFIMFSLISAIGAALVGCVAIATSLVAGAGFPADAGSLRRMILSSAFFFGYNGASFTVLGLTDPVTHSVLNVFKRYFSILCNTVLFSASFTTSTAVGLLISVAGSLLFGRSKMKSQTGSGGGRALGLSQ